MLIYKCDGENNSGVKCQTQTNELDKWLTIGSSNNSLYISNKLPEGRIYIANHGDMHFCSLACFLQSMFKTHLITQTTDKFNTVTPSDGLSYS
jgi:hypothetical protein